MPTTREVLKARVLAEVGAAIDEAWAHKKAPEMASLADIEQVALQVGQRVEAAITTALVQASGQALEADWPTCPICGKRLQAKGKRRRRVVTETGEVDIRRDYYYCRHCRQGIFPPG